MQSGYGLWLGGTRPIPAQIIYLTASHHCWVEKITGIIEIVNAATTCCFAGTIFIIQV